MNRRTFLVAFGTASLAGCAARCPPSASDGSPPTATWEQPHGGPTNAGRIPTDFGPESGPPTTEWELWRFVREAGDGDVLVRNVAASPVVGESLVFVAMGPQNPDYDQIPGHLFAIDPAKSEPAWMVRLPRGATGSPALVGGRVVVATTDGTLAAYRPGTGERDWQRTFDAPMGTPTVEGGRIYVGDEDGIVRSLRPDGSDCWSDDRGPLVEGVGLGKRPSAAFKPALDGERLYAVFWRGRSSDPPSGILVAYDRESGDEAWTYEFETRYDDPRSPAVADGTVYLPAESALHAIDAATGERRWRYDFGWWDSISTPAIDDGRAYVCAKNVHALDVESGEEVWRHVNEWVPPSGFTRRKPMVAAPVVAGDAVYAGAGALDAATGEHLWGELGDDPDSELFGPSGIDGNVAIQGPALTENSLYVTMQYGLLVRFGGEKR